MNPARLANRHSHLVILIAAVAVASGVITGLSLPSGIYPALQFPRVVVIAHEGISPARSMLLTVARPLEQAVLEVPGVRRVRSRTFRGASEISVQFEPSTDMVIALQQVQNRVSEARDSIPADTELKVARLTPAAFPILSLNLTGDLPTADLYDYGFYVMRPALARVPGVGRVEVMATDTREIEVVVDPAKLTSAGLTVEDVAGALRASNRLTAIGRYPTAGIQRLVLASGLWSSASEIAGTPIAVRNNATLRVSDVAAVFPGSPDRTNLVTGNGKVAAIVNVSQQIDANILSLRRGVEATLADLTRTLPSGLQVSKVYDLAEFVAASIANVRDAILIGGLLAIGVLLVFLRDVRLTVIAALTLPLAVIPTFLFMKIFGQSINLMSMGGLAVAIGLVIDDAVVVVERIHRQHGARTPAAVEEATAELVAPLVSSTLTTVVVFLPLGLLSGVTGQFFRALSLTLSVAVLISLALALTLIPLLGRFAGSNRIDESHGSPTSGLAGAYRRTLQPFVARPSLSWLAVAVLMIGGTALFWRTATGFLPPADEGGFVIDYLTPAGTALEETDRIVRKVEAIVAQTPEVAAFSRRTGSELGMFATQPNKGDILVRLKPRGQRQRSAEEIMADLRPKLLAAAPNAQVEFLQLLQDMIGDLEGTPTPIEVKIFGDDADVLEKVAGSAEGILSELRGVVDVVSVQRGNPEVTWTIDPTAAGRLGLTVQQVSDQMAAAWLGDVATELRLADRIIPVRVRYPDADRFDPARLSTMTVRAADGKLVPITALGRPVMSNGQSVLLRENLREMALVTARLEDRDLGSAVTELKSRLAALKLPVGYSFEVGGQYESQRQAFRELLMVFGIAAMLVLMVLVAHFRALTPALLILAAAPLSLGGALLILLVTGTELNVSSAMGLILLIGLVVKNGIMLLDYADRLRHNGQELHAALIEAGAVRLRPILMTTLCTLFGMLPLALGWGSGAELQEPLALAVIGGLTLSTLVTLYLVPSLYVALHTDKKPFELEHS